MIPPRWSLPSILEEEGAGDDSSADILAEERERRLRRRRGFRSLWLGNWLAGRTGVAVLCIFLVVGLGWLGFRQFGPGNSRVSGFSSSETAFPERVRSLTAVEHSFASRYGAPLHMGPGGRAVVQVESTGDVRELTSFEMELDSLVSYLPSRRGRIVQVPGPRGWGMWWLDDSEMASLRPLASFDRLSWRERQEQELARTVRGIILGLFLIGRLDLEFWERGLGAPLLEVASRIKEPYPPAGWGHWSGVPGLWVCDQELESDLYQGITPGCPGSDYQEALQDAWLHAGTMVDRLEGIGRYVRQMDGMDSAELHESQVMRELSYEILDLFQDVRDLEPALVRVQGVSREWGLSIMVDFTGGR